MINLCFYINWIGPSSVRKIYLVGRVLENSKTFLYGNNPVGLFEANPITVTFLLLSRDEKP